VAAERAKHVYKNEYQYGEDITVNARFAPSDKMKPTVVTTEVINGTKTAVVAIRGTKGFKDWMLNFNESPVSSKEILQEPCLWHTGFLRMAYDMQVQVAEAITALKDTGVLLFTGHSAGGAMAQLFFALSMRAETPLGKATQGKCKHSPTFKI
jgi:hypothetical protein